MIVFGNSREFLKHTESLNRAICPHCQSYGTMSAEVLTRYAHIWYIPFFPTGKRVIASCSHCKAAFDAKELPNNINVECNEIKKSVKYPLKYWTWLLILGLVFAFVILLPLINKN